MDFSVYQKLAKTTAIYPEEYAVLYPALGLVGEAGEVANKVKKILRDYDGYITDEVKVAVAQEIGDVMWYIAALCADLEIDMNDVATANLEKLSARKDSGTLGGSGDKR